MANRRSRREGKPRHILVLVHIPLSPLSKALGRHGAPLPRPPRNVNLTPRPHLEADADPLPEGPQPWPQRRALRRETHRRHLPGREQRKPHCVVRSSSHRRSANQRPRSLESPWQDQESGNGAVVVERLHVLSAHVY